MLNETTGARIRAALHRGLGGAIALGLCAQAQAQTSPTETQSAGLETIIVTAERTNRSLDRTATSVAVLTSKDIEALAGSESTYDVLERIPNVVATRAANGAPAVRGIDGAGPAVGGNAFFAGTRPRVNFLVDGRTLTFNESIYIDGGVWDAQQMEVYRGPQSTLQGRNAIGGVIAIKTADPTFDWQGRARTVIGEYNTRQYGAAFGGPLVGDSLAFRLSGEFRESDTYVKIHNTPYADPRRSRSEMVRAKLLLAPEDVSLRSLLTLSYTDSYAPQAPLVGRPFDALEYGYADSPRFQTRAQVAISDTSWTFSDDLTVSAFITASDFRVNRYTTPGAGIAQIDGREYTAEPRIRFGNEATSMSGFLAVYVFDASQDESIDLFGGARFRDRTSTQAVFGELTWNIAANVDLTVGSRYEQEERDRTGGQAPFVIDYHETFSVFLPRATLAVRPKESWTVGATIGRGYNAGGAGFAFNPPFPSFTYDQETVWNYEGFARSSLLDGRLRLNGNVFYNDYSGLQLPFDVAQNPAAPATVIRNADQATTYGAEVEVRFRALDSLDVFGGAGLLQTNVDRYSDPSVEGRDLPRSPAFSFNAGVVFRPLEHVELLLDARYTDTYYSDVFNNARGRTDPYVLANAQVNYRHGPIRVFVAATNLFDTLEPTLYYTGTTAAADVAQVTAPRKVTAGIDVSF